jgi:methionine-rich copper-binding protein CopC
MFRFVSRAVLSIAAAVVALMMATAGPALAHNELKSSNPTDGATLATAPATITLTFNEKLDVDHTQVAVTGPTGAPTAGKPNITGDTATVDLTPGPAGVYTITYSTVADDGDKSGGTIRFTVTTAAAAPASSSAEPAPPAPTNTSPGQAAPASDNSRWAPWAVGAVAAVLLLAVIIAAVGRRMRSKP